MYYISVDDFRTLFHYSTGRQNADLSPEYKQLTLNAEENEKKSQKTQNSSIRNNLKSEEFPLRTLHNVLVRIHFMYQFYRILTICVVMQIRKLRVTSLSILFILVPFINCSIQKMSSTVQKTQIRSRNLFLNTKVISYGMGIT